MLKRVKEITTDFMDQKELRKELFNIYRVLIDLESRIKTLLDKTKDPD